jgi:pyruvate dehydrogenase E2 component (dihydrolipoamide acetyltransferase)
MTPLSPVLGGEGLGVRGFEIPQEGCVSTGYAYPPTPNPSPPNTGERGERVHMPIAITIPRLGWSMTEAVFLGWLKQDGESVRAGELLYRLESDKAAEDIECLDAGILCIAANGPKEGDTIAVGVLIGHLLQPGESAPPMGEAIGREDEAPAEPLPTGVADATGSAGASSSRLSSPSQPVASPRARRTAAERGVDWSKLHGSGRGGRIRTMDVLAAVGNSSSIPLTAVRRATVEQLQKAKQAIPVTLTTSADATRLLEWRRDANASITDCFIKLAALNLRQHPLLAAQWGDDGLAMPGEIHVGFAVDTEAGLLVPVVHHAATLSLDDIAARSRDLIERAKNGKLKRSDLEGGAFTVTNLGMFGIDAFTPIINYPQCAILGLGRIRRVPVFAGEKVEAREEITLSLTFDHRIVDGAPAARFLQALASAVETPDAG